MTMISGWPRALRDAQSSLLAPAALPPHGLHKLGHSRLKNSPKSFWEQTQMASPWKPSPGWYRHWNSPLAAAREEPGRESFGASPGGSGRAPKGRSYPAGIRPSPSQSRLPTPLLPGGREGKGRGRAGAARDFFIFGKREHVEPAREEQRSGNAETSQKPHPVSCPCAHSPDNSQQDPRIPSLHRFNGDRRGRSPNSTPDPSLYPFRAFPNVILPFPHGKENPSAARPGQAPSRGQGKAWKPRTGHGKP